MEYEDIAVYTGPKVACDNCKKEFKPGEVISVDKNQNLFFCYSDSGGGCAIAHTFSSGKVTCCIPMRFRDVELPIEERTPNYPDTPLFPSWLHRFLNSILGKSS